MFFFKESLLFLLLLIPFLGYILNVYNVKFERKIRFFSQNLNKDFLLEGYILLLALVFIIIALSRPLGKIKNDKYVDNTKEIVIALDISSSMKSEDVSLKDLGNLPISRFEAGKFLINKLLDKLENKVSLSVFSETVIPITPLTQDYELIRSFLNNIDTKDIQGGTNLYLSISESIKRFSKENKDKIIILISDGENNFDYKFNIPNDLIVITVGVGSIEGSKIPEEMNIFGSKEYKTYLGEYVITKLNESTLKELSKKGKYFFLNKDISDEIIKYISKIKSANIEKELNSRDEIFDIFILASFLILIFKKKLIKLLYLLYNYKVYILYYIKLFFNKIKLI